MAESWSRSHPNWQAASGWKIESRYSDGVLVGNWSEDRLGKFKRGESFGSSTHRGDFQRYPSREYRPDASSRRNGLLRSEGLKKDQLFTHHGDRYSCNMVSLYDQQFNRKYDAGGRKWDKYRLAWIPETADAPSQDQTTNFGLKEEIEKKWKKLEELERHGDYATTYSITYRSQPTEPTVNPTAKVATPRHLSSHLHPFKVHKDLHFRGSPLVGKPEVVDRKLLKNNLAATV